MGNDRSRCDWDRPNGTNKDNSQPDRNHHGNSIDKTRSVGTEKGNSKRTRPGNNIRCIRNRNGMEIEMSGWNG